MNLSSILGYVLESFRNLIVDHPLHIIPVGWMAMFGTMVTQSLIKAIKEKNVKNIIDRLIWIGLALLWFYFSTMMNLTLEEMMVQS